LGQQEEFCEISLDLDRNLIVSRRKDKKIWQGSTPDQCEKTDLLYDTDWLTFIKQICKAHIYFDFGVVSCHFGNLKSTNFPIAETESWWGEAKVCRL
jgi:hypothetical protein